MSATSDRIIDFRPAPNGWRALFLEAPGEVTSEPLAGWLLMEDAEDGQRYVSGAICDSGGGVDAVGGIQNFWTILAPGEALPEPEAVKEEWARWEKAKQWARWEKTKAWAKSG